MKREVPSKVHKWLHREIYVKLDSRIVFRLCWNDDPSELTSRYIHTLHGLQDLLEDTNLENHRSNESTTSSVNTHNIDKEMEIQSK
ncbi:hypothetical protein Glove_84g125 [Diversispora epigaea]|uniref:Uncharacterized protein n=1 Tax=Diversispora epigaea TaxID=1348612 RepID=A0A397J835_9GLOM|nr:hypothetical protein Glove_84g125 [Diversispora epigaea]